MLGKGRGFGKADIQNAVEELKSQYEKLVSDYALNPSLVEAFYDRVKHARNARMDPTRFLDDEMKAFRQLDAQAKEKAQAEVARQEAHRRRLAGETFADKVLDELRQNIEHYPAISIHSSADFEVAKLYGAMGYLDSQYWGDIEAFLRKVFPQAGNIHRMNIEQRFWRFVSTREDRIPEALERYRRILAVPSSTGKEKIREAQDAIKSVAFFLHDLLELSENAAQRASITENVEEALAYVRDIINDFRLSGIKKY